MIVQQQGEVRIEMIDSIPDDLKPFDERTQNGEYFIVSHSESGNHHVLDCNAVELWERPLPPELGKGMRLLYAIVKNPTEMRQDANVPHETAPMQPGMYELTISTEIDPFTNQARRVED